MWGVCISEPKQDMSEKPKSSARIMMMFGLVFGDEDGGCECSVFSFLQFMLRSKLFFAFKYNHMFLDIND